MEHDLVGDALRLLLLLTPSSLPFFSVCLSLRPPSGLSDPIFISVLFSRLPGCSPSLAPSSGAALVWSAIYSDPPRVLPTCHGSVRDVALVICKRLKSHLQPIPLALFSHLLALVPPMNPNFSLLLSAPQEIWPFSLATSTRSPLCSSSSTKFSSNGCSQSRNGSPLTRFELDISTSATLSITSLTQNSGTTFRSWVSNRACKCRKRYPCRWKCGSMLRSLANMRECHHQMQDVHTISCRNHIFSLVRFFWM